MNNFIHPAYANIKFTKFGLDYQADGVEARAEPIQCSGCKKKFHADGFRVTRLGKRLKTCLECNDRYRRRRIRYNERKEAGTVDKEHGSICKRDPLRIDTEARECGVRLVDPTSYKNARTRVYWECLTCHKLIYTQWQFIHIERIACFTCAARKRKEAEIRYNEARSADQQDAILTMLTQSLNGMEHIHIPKPNTLKEVINRTNGCSSCQGPLEAYNKAGLCTECDSRERLQPPAPTPKGPNLTDDEVTTLLTEFGF